MAKLGFLNQNDEGKGFRVSLQKFPFDIRIFDCVRKIIKEVGPQNNCKNKGFSPNKNFLK